MENNVKRNKCVEGRKQKKQKKQKKTKEEEETELITVSLLMVRLLLEGNWLS